MTQSDIARVVVIDGQIAKLRDELRELQYQASSATGAAMEDRIAAHIDNAEQRLMELQGVRDAAMAGAST